MKHLTLKTLPLLFFAAPGLAASPAQILEKAENIRNPQTTYTVDVILKDEKSAKKSAPKTFKTMIKGRDKALVEFVKPEVDSGKKVLMVENNMWIYMPTTAKPLRISPRQKLAGNAAYGDIARLNYTGNYTPKLLGKKKLGKRQAFVLDLNAIDGRPVTYQKLEYWIDAKNFRPLKVLYKTKSGKTLKIGHFSGYKTVLGVVRPTKMKILDALNKGKATTLIFRNAKKASLPDILFEKQNLNRS